MKILILLMLAASCTQTKKKDDKISDYYRPKKFCHDECIKNSFKNFHTKGESWGTGSSSMNGLSQKMIFDRVMDYCADFYKDYECCRYSYMRYKGESITPTAERVHGGSYGVCNMDIKQ